MSGEGLPGVSRTAVWVAGMRAVEHTRADRLFDDEFAGRFVAAAGGDVAAQAAAALPGTSEFLAIRTRFFDDEARAAVTAGIRQMVLLAAGLDCRALRLDWPEGVRLFELDLPQVLAFKESILASVDAVARCLRVVVPVDLSGQWDDVLTGAGFDPDVATGWLAEGLLAYLNQPAVDRLLATLTALSAPCSRAAFDYLETTADQRPAMRATCQTVQQMGARLIPAVDRPADRLAEHGWATRLFRVPVLGEHYGRPLPTGTDIVASNATALITASR